MQDPNPHVAVCIAVRKYPVGPPFCVQFEGTAEVMPLEHPEIAALLGAGRLKTITRYGLPAEPPLLHSHHANPTDRHVRRWRLAAPPAPPSVARPTGSVELRPPARPG